MGLVLLLTVLAASLSLAMTLAWTVALRSGRSGWIDATWSFATGAAGVAAALTPLGPGAEISTRQIVVGALAAAWSARLGTHIAFRTARGGDDPRYARLRAEWGDDHRRRLFWFLQVQAAAGFLLVLSILAAARNPVGGVRPGDVIGVVLLAAAVSGAAIADRQLVRFRADPANRDRVCDRGLWAWSRHPNYFFEWLGWLAYAVIAISPAGGYAWGWVALTGPAFIYWLLTRVSGIPPLEAHMLRSRGQAYRAYQRRVSAFWLRPPSRGSDQAGDPSNARTSR